MRTKIVEGDGDPRHGTRSGYCDYGCRCERCRTAAATYRRARRTNNLEEAREQARKRYAENITMERARGAKRYAENAERLQASRAAYNALHPERLKATYAKYRANNVEARKATSAKWVAENPERVRAKGLQYRAEHIKETRARGAKWRVENADKTRVQGMAWRVANPDKVRNADANRRARKIRQWVENVDRVVVWDRDNGVCHICGLPADLGDWHLEHKTPLVLGGEHSYANTAVSHPLCNLRKGRSQIQAPE